MIRVEKIWKSFDDRPVLRGVDFAIESGSIVGVVGPSGGGKSVLLKILGQVLEPDSGRVILEDTSPNGVGSDSAESCSRSVGFLFQEGALFDSQSVLENVAFPLLVKRDAHTAGPSGIAQDSGRLSETLSRREILDRAYAMLDEVGLEKAYKKFPGQLSGGMRRRVGIARALVTNPELLLLDDPTGGLDPVAASVIMELIISLHKRYRGTVLIVSHDLRRLLPNVQRTLGLFAGKIVLDSPPNEIAQRASADVLRFLATRYDFAQAPATVSQ